VTTHTVSGFFLFFRGSPQVGAGTDDTTARGSGRREDSTPWATRVRPTRDEHTDADEGHAKRSHRRGRTKRALSRFFFFFFFFTGGGGGGGGGGGRGAGVFFFPPFSPNTGKPPGGRARLSRDIRRVDGRFHVPIASGATYLRSRKITPSRPRKGSGRKRRPPLFVILLVGGTIPAQGVGWAARRARATRCTFSASPSQGGRDQATMMDIPRDTCGGDKINAANTHGPRRRKTNDVGGLRHSDLVCRSGRRLRRISVSSTGIGGVDVNVQQMHDPRYRARTSAGKPAHDGHHRRLSFSRRSHDFPPRDIHSERTTRGFLILNR